MQKLNRLPLSPVPTPGVGIVRVISPVGICMEKWQAVRDRLPGRPRI